MNRDRQQELEWIEYGPDAYPEMEGLSIVESPIDWHVGQHFAKPVPERAKRPGWWARLWQAVGDNFTPCHNRNLDCPFL